MKAMTKTEDRPVREEQQQQQPQQVNRLYLSPRVNITETKEGYLLEAEMPGVNRSGLEILLEASELTIVGKRHIESGQANLVYQESAPRDFRRVFVLDPTIDTPKIEAKIDNGLLTLHLPKAERVQPRKITVT